MRISSTTFHPLSSSQREIWFDQIIHSGVPLYNIGGCVEIPGPVDPDLFRKALQQVVYENDAMRIVLHPGDPLPCQELASDPDIPLRIVDVSSAVDPERAAGEWMQREFSRPFNLYGNLLFDCALLQINDRRFCWLIKQHHVIGDAWSISLMVRRVAQAYSALLTGHTSSAIGASYLDYVRDDERYLASPRFEADRQYWAKKYADTPEPLLARPHAAAFRGPVPSGIAHMWLERTFYDELSALATDLGATTFQLMLGVLYTYFVGVTGRPDFAIGLPILNRASKAFKGSLGLFAGVSPARFQLGGDLTFAELIGAIGRELRQDYRHQRCPLSEIKNLSEIGRTGRQPLFDLTLSFERLDYHVAFGEVPSESRALLNGYEQNALAIFVRDLYRTSDVRVDFSYSLAAFSESDMTRFMPRIRGLLEAVLVRPHASIRDLPVLPDDERRHVLSVLDAVDCPFPSAATIVSIFDEQVSRHPDREAVTCEGRRVSYRELDEHANRIATSLRARIDLAPDDRVALLMERNEWMIAAVLGILKAGAAYVPIDPEYPRERIAFIAADSGVRACVTERHLMDLLPDGALAVCVDDLPTNAAAVRPAALTPAHLAYVIYTSGTSGQPKGVMIEHRHVVRLLFNDACPFDFNQDDTWTLFHSICFDFSVWELFGALLTGGRLVVVPKATTRDPRALADLLRDERVTILNQTPRAFYPLASQMLSTGAPSSRLRHVIFGGEALAPRKLAEWAVCYPEARLSNMYGITETTVHVTLRTLSLEDIQGNSANIGGPIPTLSIYVLNERLEPVPIGVPGELCVGGAGVARGYLNRPELTREKFVDNPYRSGDRLYRSGDRARLLENGNLEYLGRIDQQVKIRGFRIEPAEIEHALLQHPGVHEAVVRTRRTGEDDVLCAWYTARETNLPTSAEELRAAVAAQLPDYMVPAWFVRLDAVPLTANGKVDIAALPAPGDGGAMADHKYEAPADEIERTIADIWSRVLDVHRVGARDNFFHVGGDSIRAIRAVGRMNTRFGDRFGVADLYREPTVAALANYLRQSGSAPQNDERTRHIDRVTALRAAVLASGKVVAADVDDVFPMSDIEKGLVYYYLRHLGSGVYHDQFVYEISYAGFDPVRFERALTSVVRTHPALRSSFDMETVDEFVQIVWREARVDFEHADLSGIGADARDAFVERLLADDQARPFDITRAPLWRMRSVQLDGDRVGFVFSFHHAILDGWSFVNFNVELHRAYVEHREPVAPACTYRDAVIDELVEREHPVHAEFWRDELGEYRRLDVSDKRRSGGVAMRTLRRDLGADFLIRLRAAAMNRGTSVKTLCFAAYAFAASLLSSDDEIVVGHVTNVRPSAEDGDRILGCFLNTVPVRLRFRAPVTWNDFVHHIDAQLLAIKPHERTPLMRIAEIAGETNRDHNPFFDTLFNFMDFHLYDEVNRAEGMSRFSYEKTLGVDGSLITNTLLDFEVNITAGRFVLCPKYNPDAVSDGRVERLCDAFLRALDLIDRCPNDVARKIDVMPPAERDWLLVTLNDTSVPYTTNATLHALFESQVARGPERVAIVADGQTLTYGELNAQANHLAWALRAEGVRDGQPVAVLMDRTPGMIVAVLATLKAGGAYVPIDPDFPEARILYVLESLRIGVAIAAPRVRERLETVEFDRPLRILAPDTTTLFSASPGNLPPASTADDHAYVIFTSGSTGTPKGVIVAHRTVVNVIEWVNRTFAVSERDRLLFVTSLGFDLSVYDIFGMLAAGGSIRVANREDIRDPRRLLDLLTTGNITFWDSAPAMLQQLAPLFVEIGPRDTVLPLRLVFLSGDWIPVTLPDAVRKAFPHAEVVSLGGATEATIWSNFFRIGVVDPDWPSIPYGTPIQNAKYYVLDHSLDLCPTSVSGDLYIGGECLALGYHDAALTKERFLPNPFAQGERIYKTGDNARWMPDGQMEFLGRSDHQLKIRGFRVEPGEIEHQLLQHPAVKEALVAPYQARHDQRELAAYLVLSQEIAAQATVSALRAYLTEFLPDYMVPTSFVALDRFPLSSNGKVDRHALPSPDDSPLALGHAHIAPRNALETGMARIWETVLDRRPVGVTDNFFDLGGQSLTATQVVSRTRKELGTDLTLRNFFLSPTIAALAAVAEAQTADSAFRAITPIATSSHYELSHAQRRLWILDQFDKDKITYSLPASYVVHGHLDISALTDAVRDVIARHEMLRTTFHELFGKPVQTVHDIVNFDIDVTDLRAEPAPRDRARALALEDAYRPFDLATAPLLRMHVLRVTDNERVLLFNMHHIISDGWSLNLLVDELMKAYAARRDGAALGLDPLPIHYNDYAAWQNQLLASPGVDDARAYWHERFAGEIPALDLPTDFSRPAAKSFHGDTVRHTLDPMLAAALRRACRDEATTLFMGLVAAVKMLLHRYTGQTEIVIGAPIAGRDHVDLEQQIGFYVNLLPLRDTIHPTDSFHAVLQRVKHTTTGAYQHQVYPFDRLVDEVARHRDVGRNPLFDVAVALENAPPRAIQLGAASLEPFIENYQISRFDLTFTFVEDGDDVRMAVEYSTDLFRHETIQRTCRHLEQLLRSAIEAPDRSLADLAMLPADERRRILVDWNQTATSYPREATLAALFTEQAHARPSHPAIVDHDRVVNYGELNALANRIARTLLRRRIGRGDVVAIMGDRSAAMIAAVMGVLKTGAAYLPLTPDMPHSRVRYMLHDAGVHVVLSDGGRVEIEADGIEAIAWHDPKISAEDASDVPAAGSGDDLAYVIYTSGSTGSPKGTLVRQRSVTRVVRDTTYLRITPDDCLIQLSNFAFDGSVFDIFGALLNGASLVMTKKDDALSPFALGDILRRHRVSVMFVTTALFNTIVDTDLSSLAGTRQVLFGGERVSVKHVRAALQALGPGRLVHVYGPTETTVFATAHPVDAIPDDAETIPIGTPISNTSVYVLSPDRQLVPVGVPGVLYIGGDGVSKGYLNQDALTDTKFVPDPFHDGRIMYASGDIVRWRRDGTLEFLGREDGQIKIRGFRIELGEITHALLTHPVVKDAMVTVYAPARGSTEIPPHERGDLRLCAYVVTSADVDAAELKAHLARSLPEQMIPFNVVFLGSLPLTANGKVDIKALPDPDLDLASDARRRAHVPPRTALEQALAGIWEEALGVAPIGVHDNFFELGGHSLKATQIVATIYQRLQVKLELKTMFTDPTVADIASHIEAIQWVAQPRLDPPSGGSLTSDLILQ